MYSVYIYMYSVYILKKKNWKGSTDHYVTRIQTVLSRSILWSLLIGVKQVKPQ